MQRALCWAIACLCFACGDADIGAPGPSTDCRANGVGCTEGFRRQLNDNARHECLPDATQPDATMVPMPWPTLPPHRAAMTA